MSQNHKYSTRSALKYSNIQIEFRKKLHDSDTVFMLVSINIKKIACTGGSSL